MTTLKGHFETRREAEIVVERLVQDYGIDRAAMTMAAVGKTIIAGVEQVGSDTLAKGPSKETCGDAAREGRLLLVVELDDDTQAQEALATFAEFSADQVEQQEG